MLYQSFFSLSLLNGIARQTSTKLTRIPTFPQPKFLSEQRRLLSNNVSQTTYQDSRDRDLRLKQRQFQPLTQAVYIQREEVAQYDGFKLVEGMIDKTKPAHELHLIKKIGGLRKQPHWVRKALAELGFNIKKKQEWDVVYSIQPNTTRVNDLLWLCKHMVKVSPIKKFTYFLLLIKFKNGHPSEKDIGASRLNLETGEFEIIKPLEVFSADDHRLDCYKVNDVPVSEDIRPSDAFPLQRRDLHRDFHRRYQLQRLNDEYFPARYDYTLDQDKPGVIRLSGKPTTDVSEDDSKDMM